MSYLDSPRIHFTGFFQADVSTGNNDVRYFDVDAFQPEYQQLSLTGDGGSWHPNGTGVFRFVNCQITGASLDGRAIYAQSQDAVIGMSLQNADDRAPGKMVDLDPQQQAVSEIWGMGVRLTNGRHRALFAGDYAPAAFTNLWARQQTGVLMDQKLGACYGSVLENVRWEGDSDSPVLEELADLSEHGLLAIQFNVYGYGRDPTIPRYTMGDIGARRGRGRRSLCVALRPPAARRAGRDRGLRRRHGRHRRGRRAARSAGRDAGDRDSRGRHHLSRHGRDHREWQGATADHRQGQRARRAARLYPESAVRHWLSAGRSAAGLRGQSVELHQRDGL